MIIVRALVAALKPAIATGAIAATAAGGWLVYDTIRPDGLTAFERIQDDGQRLLVSEFGENADTIFAIDPADPAGTREEIATIDHAPGFGVFATLSPDGQAIAYTALPVDTDRAAPDSPAVAGIVDANGDVTVLATDVDLLIPPVWSPDGSSIVVRKNAPEENDAGSFELLLLGRDGSSGLVTAWQSAAAFPIGFSPDGTTVYFATLNASGTDLYRVARDGSGETLIAHLSDEIARDWQLAPDGSTIAYSTAESGNVPVVVAKTVDVSTGAIADALAPDDLLAGPPSTGVARGEFNPTWSNDGELTVASLQLDGGSEALTLTADGERTTTAADEDGIDLPLGWSPDGETLAVRAVDGETPFEAGESYMELVQPDGSRERVSESSDVLVVGWME